MNKEESKKEYWSTCKSCYGQGKKRRRIQKKVRLQYQRALEQFEKSKGEGKLPVRPKGQLYVCHDCKGSGLIFSEIKPLIDTDNYPHIAIVGAGIGGVALAVACLHRGIPFTLYERDDRFDARSQGYGLTLQQASKAIEGFGIFALKDGVVSTRHVVHTMEGEIIGEWGMRKWLETDDVATSSKRTNVHIPRQSLRLALLEQLDKHNTVQWGHQLVDFKQQENDEVTLDFQVNGKMKTAKSDLLVGADGIRSSVRKLLIGDEITPLRYLGCIVILGICPLNFLEGVSSPLLDSATVFQTANGNERIYMMPFTKDSVMWQLSFPMLEDEAKELSAKGAKALKAEAYTRVPWHHPIPQILEATLESEITGYPVYDRALLKPEFLEQGKQVTLIGDAAHPMSPFKGQGANQALLDALALARGISKGCRPLSLWKEVGIRTSVLKDFESEMLKRSAIKVKDSAAAAEFLHSDIVLHKSDEPRGRVFKKKKG
ncbi:monooxygenase [Wenyingzhuangia fucanilytica]|uniref:Monooxygenase n=1 Tax=Wenyingzhuangia fucanilytica TaxID=1790137 RepID=A0A1B1Y4V6_9FLAO|nr:NAD(P)/FAD-dependent oxidoreductase [Wenyingzhuangia fucanilytica]ANW95779.1 monooxygenase [Wenyingzhuangia fucanilytica]